MSVLAVVAPLLSLLAVAVPLLLVVGAVGRGLPRDASDEVDRAARRRVRTASRVSVGVAVVATVVVLALGDDLPLAVGPLGIGVLAVVAATLLERSWPRPAGTVRTPAVPPPPAPPRLLPRVWVGSAPSLAVLCVGGMLLSAPDGRSLEVHWAGGAAGHSPFPGWRYSLPALVALAVLVLATRWGLRTVEGRPALDPAHEQVDADARVTSTARLLRAAAVATLVTVAAFAYVAGSALAQMAQTLRMNQAPVALAPPFDWRQDLGFALFGVMTAAVVLALVTLGAGPTRAPAPAAAADPVLR